MRRIQHNPPEKKQERGGSSVASSSVLFCEGCFPVHQNHLHPSCKRRDEMKLRAEGNLRVVWAVFTAVLTNAALCGGGRESGKRRGALLHYTERGRRPSGQESQDRIEIQQSWSRSQHTGLCWPGFTPLHLCVTAYHIEMRPSSRFPRCC